METYTLYKNPIQLDTLAIVQFLHSIGIHLVPNACIERNHPGWVTELPSIETSDGRRYVGYDACIEFFQETTQITDLQQKSALFKLENPSFRIHGDA
jgi:hypothetical protein